MFKLLVILLLIAMTALFVIIEVSLRTLHPRTIEVWEREGRRGAAALRTLSERLDQALPTCQLAITANSLTLGWLGQPAVRSLLAPLFVRLPFSATVETFFSFLIAFVSITYLHVVLGGLVPQVLAAQRGGAVVLAVAKPLLALSFLLSPVLWLLNRSSRRIVSILGLKPAANWSDAHSEEELRILLSESLKSGQINKSEYRFVNRIFAFDELLAKDIMVPRTDMVCLDATKSREENLRIIRQEQYTRFPVIRQNKDNIIGVINTKALFLAPDNQAEAPLASLVRPVMTVTENIPLPALLTKMQKERSHIAVLIDEYGGTSGMVTIEDILEEIVGDIRDEFDAEEEQEITEVAANHLIVDGKVSVSLINDLLDAELEEEDADTIGGWVYGQNLDFEAGTQLVYGDLQFTVLEREDSRIRKIEIEKRDPSSLGNAFEPESNSI
ncbi:MAG: hemolysin family protein [Paenibacillaceae bacterium]|uniref:Hemolysin family protein n=1 Tax=Paenibacillus mellifer TaxID=2937794 RepID=A0A9X1Y056_9BACL|nr:hemolysin family protein [Paenibacillus mellifer]MBW4837838.1 hemolysin family protein [Paenibacillaceae bacterium]MCK8488469.1 hemolysin family protein [Paenibacillus mellifer]